MNCPVCRTPLARGSYEEIPVFRCSDCRGYLVDSQKAKTIRSRIGLSIDELKAEVLADEQPDQAALLTCPRCRRRMGKQKLRCAGEFHLDVCDECRFIWFDGGELAIWQLAHENSDQGREAAALQQRHRSMTHEERANLQERIDQLPDAPSTLQTLFEGAIEGLHFRRWHRLRR